MGRLRYIRLTRRQRVRVWLAIILLALTALFLVTAVSVRLLTPRAAASSSSSFRISSKGRSRTVCGGSHDSSPKV